MFKEVEMNKKQIELFKEEMKYYIWLKDTIKRLKNKIDDLFYEMTRVKGISYDKERVMQNSQKLNEQQLDMIEKYNDLIITLKIYEDRLNFLDNVLNTMNLYDRKMFLLKYEDGLTFQQIANQYYVSKAGLFYRMNKALEGVEI